MTSLDAMRFLDEHKPMSFVARPVGWIRSGFVKDTDAASFDLVRWPVVAGSRFPNLWARELLQDWECVPIAQACLEFNGDE